MVEEAINRGAFQKPEELRQLVDLIQARDFQPKNNDGEFVSFSLEEAGHVIDIARKGDDFKFNVNLVLIDFGLRHGIISPDHPDYLALTTGIHRPFD